jgi:enterochelin esterase-like enzyme
MKEFRAVPDEYRNENERQGVVESLEYNVTNLPTGADTKHLNVYLPYGYDADNTSQRYNVLYLMHGGGEDENLIFGGPGENRELKNILDNMIANGDIVPIIVVTPTFYGVKNGKTLLESNGDWIPIIETKYFHDELINNIIPLVETRYHTYAMSADREDIKASREHRAFGGFSMGSVTTWYTYVNCLDYIKYFLPLSGDCWAFGVKAGSAMAKETAEYLAKAAKDSGYAPKDYCLFCATGNDDIAYLNLKPQIDAIRRVDDEHLLTVGYSDVIRASLKANEVLGFASVHRYPNVGACKYRSVIYSVTHKSEFSL